MWQVKNVYAVCAFAAIGGGLFGFDISSMAGVIGTEAYKEYFGNPTGYTQGYIVAAMPGGSIIGTIIASFIGDKLSRKVAIQLSCIFWILGSALQAASINIPMLVIGRIVGGLGIGLASTIVPIYQAEISPKETRGKAIGIFQLSITIGILIGFFIQFGSSFIDGGPDNQYQSTLAFRLPWAIQTVPAIILLFGLVFFPYSPRWLASKDRWEEAVQVLADLHAHGDLRSPKVLAQYREIEESLRFEQETAAAGWAALLEARMFKRVVLGIVIQMFSGLSGINVLMYYVVYLMESAQMGSPLVISLIQYILNVVMTLPALIYMDSWGRRPLMLVGAIFMSTLLFASGALQAVYGEPNPDSTSETTWIIVDNLPVSRAVVACSYIFVAFFSVSWGPCSWTYPSEIFPNKVRSKAVSLSTASNWITNTILAFAVPPLLNSISWRMYLIFGTFNALAFIYIFFCAPETKNITLEEMDTVFVGKGWLAGFKSRRGPKVRKLDELEMQIATGDVKIQAPGDNSDDQKLIMAETVIEMTHQPRSASFDSEISASDHKIDSRTRSSSTPVEWYHAK